MSSLELQHFYRNISRIEEAGLKHLAFAQIYVKHLHKQPLYFCSSSSGENYLYILFRPFSGVKVTIKVTLLLNFAIFLVAEELNKKKKKKTFLFAANKLTYILT